MPAVSMVCEFQLWQFLKMYAEFYFLNSTLTVIILFVPPLHDTF